MVRYNIGMKLKSRSNKKDYYPSYWIPLNPPLMLGLNTSSITFGWKRKGDSNVKTKNISDIKYALKSELNDTDISKFLPNGTVPKVPMSIVLLLISLELDIEQGYLWLLLAPVWTIDIVPSNLFNVQWIGRIGRMILVHGFGVVIDYLSGFIPQMNGILV